MQDGVIPLFSRDRTKPSERRGGWSNQDLAELYRIEAALVQAGISIDTELGETDEGDPWFAFCRADTGDVLVHVAIIDGEYHIAGASSSTIVKGYSFTDIVRQFMTREPAFLLGTARHNNVMIHPSSVLIAVFAAICLISEEYNQEILAFAAQEKAAAGENGRSESDTYNIADQRHVALGDFTFSPQQVFIILSAIAFSASPIVQNKSPGLEAALGVFDLIDSGVSDVEQSFETFVADLWEEGFSLTDPENRASKEYAQALSDQQFERSEAKALAAEQANAEFVAEDFQQVEPETRDPAYSPTGEQAVAESDQPAAPEQETLVQQDPEIENDVAVTPVITPPTVQDFFRSNAEFADAGEEISGLIDAFEIQYDESTDIPVIPVTSDVDLSVNAGLVENNIDSTAILPIEKTTTPPIEKTTTPPIENTTTQPDFGFDIGNTAGQSLKELAFIFNTFEDTHGEALIDDKYDRYIIHNDSAKEVAYDDNTPGLAILRYELDDGTPVYFLGMDSDFDYQMIA